MVSNREFDQKTFAAASEVRFDDDPINTSVLQLLLARMQRIHDKRRSGIFVGPPGIGKTTAIQVFCAANPRQVLFIPVLKRGITGPQVLQQLLRALRAHNGSPANYITNATEQLTQYVAKEIYRAGGELLRDENPYQFPKLTIVFDEAQRLTNGALDALRGYNEPHYLCTGTFPLGMIFVGNDELSLENRGSGSILDEGMRDRLMYAERLSYNFVTADDVMAYAGSIGVDDAGAQAAIARRFGGERTPRSFRQIERFVDECRDEAAGGAITAEVVQSIVTL